jgi:hypothetical protein
MARYNHFGICPYKRILFKDLNIGDEFRYGRHRNGRVSYPVAVKTGEYGYRSKRSKEEFRIGSFEGYQVYERHQSIFESQNINNNS